MTAINAPIEGTGGRGAAATQTYPNQGTRLKLAIEKQEDVITIEILGAGCRSPNGAGGGRSPFSSGAGCGGERSNK